MKVAVVQMTSSSDFHQNLEMIKSMLTQASKQGVELISFPENCLLFTKDRKRIYDFAQNHALQTVLPQLQSWAQEFELYLCIGTLQVMSETHDDRYYNRSYVIAPSGRILAHYDKIHMFDVNVGDGQRYQESQYCEAGSHIVLVDTPQVKLGLSICYDIRFPYLYRQLAQRGAQIILIPAAFTVPTGQAHWHVLARARAIETGAYILASAQAGTNEEGRSCYGHSLIISPWGEVLHEITQEQDLPFLGVFDIDLHEVEKVRQKLPSLEHVRGDLLV